MLRYIYYRDAGISCPPDSSDCAFRNVSVLLPLLERGGLIRCICPESPDSPVSYELCKPLGSIDLLDPARGGVSGFSGCRRAACLWPLWVGGLPYGGCQPDDAQHIQRNPFDRTLFVNRFLEIAAMNRILLLLGYILLLSAPVCGRGVGTRAVSDCDSLHTFRFVQGRDVLYADYQGNNHELKRLFAAVSSFRGPIADGKMRIYVDGHCTSGGSVHDNLWLAYVRSSRVKSELITRKSATW